MSLRARIFIIISIVMLLVLGVSIFLVVRNNKKSAEPQTGAPTDNTSVIGNGQPGGQAVTGTQVPAGLPAKTATPLEAEKNGVVQLAKVFVERYGTYSTDNNFQNIKEVETFVTLSLWSKISAPISAKSINQSFVGVTTKVISMDLASWFGIRATVELKTTRTEEKNGVLSTRQQNATVDMVKTNAVWLVDKLVWN
jgi:hypothetical protein